MEYLREFLEGKDEAIEFLDAVGSEKSHLEKIISEKDEVIQNLNDLLDERPYYELETIDCGIGVIEYVQPDNIKLQIMMEEFKERVQHVALH